MEHDRVLPQDNEGEISAGGLLEEASAYARTVLESVQAAAGTTYCKGVQINALKKFAVETNCWIDNMSTLGIYTDRGSENEVYMSYDGHTVFKLNDFRYSEDNLTAFFKRMEIHNALFPDCAYTLIGFAKNRDGKTCAVLEQPFIQSDREATQEEIAGTLALMGFVPQQEGEYFTNSEIDIFDALPNNVLHSVDNHFYFIDTIIYPTDHTNLDTYKSLSNRFS